MKFCRISSFKSMLSKGGYTNLMFSGFSLATNCVTSGPFPKFLIDRLFGGHFLRVLPPLLTFVLQFFFPACIEKFWKRLVYHIYHFSSWHFKFYYLMLQKSWPVMIKNHPAFSKGFIQFQSISYISGCLSGGFPGAVPGQILGRKMYTEGYFLWCLVSKRVFKNWENLLLSNKSKYCNYYGFLPPI